MKRLLSLTLALLLICSCLPRTEASAPKRPSSWEAIQEIETRAEDGIEVQNEETRAAVYTASVDRMISAVQAAGDYVPGSLTRHGDFFFWETADGRVNGYSPSLRAGIRTGAAQRNASAAETQDLIPTKDPANTSDNRNVAVFIPYSDSYYFKAADTVARGAAAAHSTCGELTVYLQQDANVDNLSKAIANNGFLLINSHGTTDYEVGTDHTSRANSSYICLPTDAGFTAADQRPVSGPYGTYYHAFYSGTNNSGDEEYYCVDGTCIANHMQTNAPNSMVWLGFCLGMATEGLYAPLREKGVKTMIGFSQPVTCDADHEYTDAFCRALIDGKTVGEAAAIMKEEVGCPDPYQTAHAPAWPIAVSDQDPYPGRGHVDEAQEVHSTWELYPAYPIQVTLEPEEGGAVVINRTVLTVLPNTGYRFSDWEITAGEATAEQKGSVLSFTLPGPCAVTIRFEARTPSTLHFSVGPGQQAAAISGYIDDVVTLPAPEGELDADAYLYHFVGWTQTPLETDKTERPSLLAAGTRLTLTETTSELYAVYGYFAPENAGSQGQFRRVDEAPEDWAGDYVLTYRSSKALRADDRYTGTLILSPSAVVSNESAGYFIDGDWLNEVPDTVVYEFVPCSNGTWLLKMKGSENYLAVTSASDLLTTTASPKTAGVNWKLSWTDNGALMKNARFASKILQYVPSSAAFFTLSSLRTPLTLYVREPGEHRYTTDPKGVEPDPLEPTPPDPTPPEPTPPEPTPPEPTPPEPTPPEPTPPEPEFRFDDVLDPKKFYFAPVYWAYSHDPQITSGTTASTFSPNQTCTRAQIVTFLWRAAGCPEPILTESPFTDVQKPGAFYYQAVLWAYENGITTGVNAVTFGVNGSCTRGQVVTFLWRLAGSPTVEVGDNPFTDVKPDAYYCQPVLWAKQNEITSGTTPTTFSPGKSCTRAQCVTFLYRYMHFSE